ncbi:DNA polymerase kappa [Morella rubra]|uniref:DNA polymerase kappa n=1 Tax=Morella rubra TaxID=262757 RepID=A0A6A1V876_9ROSI|nr:DNA polymerase kappa [Morella rubra]
MGGVDKEKVQRTVYEMSKGSKYFENEERKEAFTRRKIESMRVQCSKLTPEDISHFQMVADKRILELEATRDLSRIWLHVDMDAFYAAVETLSDPTLKGKPMAVGGMSMISTANYEARRFGVRAAMPGFIARKLCPELIFVPVDFKKYTHYSELTRKVFQKYDPNFMAASLDEAYLDITDVCKERGLTGGELLGVNFILMFWYSAFVKIAQELRTTVYEETVLTCSAGVGPNRLLAKVCSDINKPDGQFVLPHDLMAVMTFISSLPIRKIGGIGKVTEHILRDVFGISTCEDMLRKGGFLCALFSRSTADFFLSVALGLGETETPQVKLRKSISNERTFAATENEALLHQKLLSSVKVIFTADLAEMLSADMQKEGLSGRTLTLKLKTSSFEVRTRAVTLQKYISSSEDILKHATKLLKAELPVSLRLIAICCYGRNPKSIGEIERDCFLKLNCRSSFPSKFLSAPSVNIPDPKPHQNEGSELLEADPSSMQLKRISLDEVNRRANTLDDEPVSSSNRGQQLLWINDYECSLCGIELRPSFAEERQEHFDFHLAERLQNEESRSGPRTPMPRQRFSQKDDIGSNSKRKRTKSSPKEKGHIPIDVFFVKSKQNL